ncbi:MAG TPA: hypothetical protein VFS11_05805 [Gemmatimonadales bacterium]|nr:hypothetical protein [Gemmatimonadales bacterium]
MSDATEMQSPETQEMQSQELEFDSADELFALAAERIPTEFVPLPELKPGYGMWLRGMTAAGRDRFEAGLQKKDKRGRDAGLNLANFRARIVLECAVTRDGRPRFQPEQLLQIGQMPASVVAKLAEVGMRLSGLGAKEEEALAGNSDAPDGDA